MSHPVYDELREPHKSDKGRVFIRQKVVVSQPNDEHLGYFYEVYFFDHFLFKGEFGRTSLVVKENKDGTFETLNSVYTKQGVE